ncbi:MAG: VanZ family protein [Candidatus Coatesbacteria bacterium]|nr:VanZ family protein [Candidatus Coatesbacteria bacterium]
MSNRGRRDNPVKSSRQRALGNRTGLTNRPMLAWGLLVGYCALVFIGSSVSRLPRELSKVPDYVLHFSEYFVMGLLANLAFRTRPLSFRIWMASVLATLFCACYAMSDEFHQYFVAGRSASLHDIGADLLGAAFAQVVILLLRRIMTSRRGNDR